MGAHRTPRPLAGFGKRKVKGERGERKGEEASGDRGWRREAVEGMEEVGGRGKGREERGSVATVRRFNNPTVSRVNFKAQPLKLRLALTLTLTLTDTHTTLFTK